MEACPVPARLLHSSQPVPKGCCIVLNQHHRYSVQVSLNTCSLIFCPFLQLPQIPAPWTICLIPLCHTPTAFCLQPVGFYVTAQFSNLLCESLSVPQSTVPLGSTISLSTQAGFLSVSWVLCSGLGCRDSCGQSADVDGQKNKPGKWGCGC